MLKNVTLKPSRCFPMNGPRLAYEWRQWELEMEKKVMFLFEPLLALSFLFTGEGGGRREAL